jgi:hypothetical protein
MNFHDRARFLPIAIVASLASLIGLPAMAQSGAELERATRVSEALRQISVRGQTRSPGYYSDWQVKGDRIPLWSKQCLGRSITPEEFDSNQATAGTIVSCIVRDMMKLEIRTARNDEALAVQRVSAWWVTGDPNQFQAQGVAPYTKQVLLAYQGIAPGSMGSVTPNPIAVTPTPIPQPAVTPVVPNPTIPTPAPVLPVKPPQVVPTQEVPATRPTAEKPPETKPPAKPAEKPPVSKPPESKPPEAKPPESKPPEAKPPEAKPADKVTVLKGNGTNFYDRYMQTGYAASRAKDYPRAIRFFQRALDERPGDGFAQKALDNMNSQQAKP